MAAGGEPGGICSDAFEALTISRIPNPAERILRLSRLHLRISHPAPRPLSTSLNKGEYGCVTLLASGWLLIPALLILGFLFGKGLGLLSPLSLC